MDGGEREEGGWALKIKSVIVFGRIGFIDETEEICRISKLLSLKFQLANHMEACQTFRPQKHCQQLLPLTIWYLQSFLCQKVLIERLR